MAVKRNALGKGMNGLFPDYKKKKTEEKEKEAGKKPSEKKTAKAEPDQEPDVSMPAASIPASSEPVQESDGSRVVILPVSDVGPNPDQPRKQFNEDTLLELTDSIRQHGVISPILVQKKEGYYEIIAGERRWRAAKLAGLKEIPAIVREYTTQEALEISLIENIQREDLNPIEEAQALQVLLTQFGITQDTLAERVGKSRAAITNALRLLKLDARVMQMVVEEMISSGHARALLGIADGEQQYQAAMRIFDQKLSVRETEHLVRQIVSGKTESKKSGKETSPALDLIYRDMEDQMKAALGTKVTLNRRRGNKGKIEIEYYSGDELERIYNLLRDIARQS